MTELQRFTHGKCEYLAGPSLFFVTTSIVSPPNIHICLCSVNDAVYHLPCIIHRMVRVTDNINDVDRITTARIYSCVTCINQYLTDPTWYSTNQQTIRLFLFHEWKNENQGNCCLELNDTSNCAREFYIKSYVRISVLRLKGSPILLLSLWMNALIGIFSNSGYIISRICMIDIRECSL